MGNLQMEDIDVFFELIIHKVFVIELSANPRLLAKKTGSISKHFSVRCTNFPYGKGSFLLAVVVACYVGNMATSDVHVRVCEQEILKYDLEIKALIQVRIFLW